MVILTLIKTLIRAYVGAEILKGFPLAPLQLHVYDSCKQALGSLNVISKCYKQVFIACKMHRAQ